MREKVLLAVSHNPKKYESHCLRGSAAPNQKALFPVFYVPVLESTVCSYAGNLIKRTIHHTAHEKGASIPLLLCLLPSSPTIPEAQLPAPGSSFLHRDRASPGSIPSSWGQLFFPHRPRNSTAFHNYSETDSNVEPLESLRKKRNHLDSFSNHPLSFYTSVSNFPFCPFARKMVTLTPIKDSLSFTNLLTLLDPWSNTSSDVPTLCPVSYSTCLIDLIQAF